MTPGCLRERNNPHTLAIRLDTFILAVDYKLQKFSLPREQFGWS